MIVFHATAWEVVLIALVGGFIGYILGLRTGVYLAGGRE